MLGPGLIQARCTDESSCDRSVRADGFDGGRDRARPAGTAASSTSPGTACRPTLLARLDAAAREFFALPEADKMEIAMARGGRAWRGFFPVGAELTSGRPDRKEGLYFGTELRRRPAGRRACRCTAATSSRAQVPELRAAVLDYLDALTGDAQAVLRGVALSLGLEPDYFAAGYTRNPTVLFRIFHYPPRQPTPATRLGRRRAHRLRPAHAAGPGRQRRASQVRTPRGLDRRAAAARHLRLQHRRHARPAHRRLLPVDAAPGAQHQRPRAAVVPVLLRPRLRRRGAAAARAGPAGRRRRATALGRPGPAAFTGTYGDYLLGKVAKVFPQLQSNL